MADQVRHDVFFRHSSSRLDCCGYPMREQAPALYNLARHCTSCMTNRLSYASLQAACRSIRLIVIPGLTRNLLKNKGRLWRLFCAAHTKAQKKTFCFHRRSFQRQRADSNRRIRVLQTRPLPTWVRRHNCRRNISNYFHLYKGSK